MPTLRMLLILLALFCLNPRVEALAELAADVNLGLTGRSDGDPRDFARLDNLSYFRACERVHGCELWQTDGTSAGTVMLADICPGPCSSSPTGLRVTFGSTIYFSADDGIHGQEPWQYRPDLVAPRMVGDVNPGADGSSPTGFVSITSSNLAGVFFVATIGTESSSANAIIRASESTSSVQFNIAVPPGAVRSIGPMVVLNDRLYFRAFSQNDAIGTELWTLHAPSAGTFALTLMRDIFPGSSSSSIDQITPVFGLGAVFFRAADSTGNIELWKSNGTPTGTVLVKDIRASGSSSPDELIAMGNRLYFFANDATLSAGDNRELWSSDGTSAGTVNVIELRSGTSGSNPLRLRVLGNRLIFTANDGGGTGQEFYSSNGTAAGTSRVVDLVAGSGGVSAFAYNTEAVVAGGFYYLSSNVQLFRTDGTAAGSRQVGQNFSDAIIGVQGLHASANSVLFSVNTFAEGAELYQSRFDTPSQANLLRVIGDQVGHSDPLFFHALPGGNITLAFDDVDGFEWRQLKPGGGATLLVELAAGANTYSPVSQEPVRSTFGPDRLWFISDFNELWVTDGSVAGTQRVFDFSSLPISMSNISCLAARGSEVMVLLRNFSPDRKELWLSDGTADGTHALLTPENVPFDTALDDRFCPAPAGTAILVSASSSGVGNEMFRSNGTAGNLTLLRDFVPGQSSGFPREPFVAAGAFTYFSVGDEFNDGNVELWRTNGTAQGTQKVVEINPTGSSNPRQLTRFADDLLFVADDGSSGFELYRTDGSAAGTTRITDLFPGPGSGFGHFASDPNSLVIDATGRIVFSALDGTPEGGRDLFVSDGTQAGTHRVSPTSAQESVQPRELLALADGGVLFAGYTPETGRELWFSDGSDDGTFLITDIVPGTEGGGPQKLSATADGAMFSANDGEHGLEPWKVVLAIEVELFKNGFE